jgi:hypothetical protein
MVCGDVSLILKERNAAHAVDGIIVKTVCLTVHHILGVIRKLWNVKRYVSFHRVFLECMLSNSACIIILTFVLMH